MIYFWNVLQFETWYRSYNSERCFVVTSTTNTDWPELTPDSEADPAAGIYEVFPGISGDGGADIGENPTTWRINISGSAGGQEQALDLGVVVLAGGGGDA